MSDALWMVWMQHAHLPAMFSNLTRTHRTSTWKFIELSFFSVLSYCQSVSESYRNTHQVSTKKKSSISGGGLRSAENHALRLQPWSFRSFLLGPTCQLDIICLAARRLKVCTWKARKIGRTWQDTTGHKQTNKTLEGHPLLSAYPLKDARMGFVMEILALKNQSGIFGISDFHSYPTNIKYIDWFS